MTVESKPVAVGTNAKVSFAAPDIQGQAELPDDVLTFAADQGIVQYVQKALAVAREVFADADRVTAVRQKDEYGDLFVDIQVVTPDDPEAEAEKYSTCVEKWASVMPPDAGSKIHLSTSQA